MIRNRDQPPDDPYRVDDEALRKAINAGRGAKVTTFRRPFIIIILMLLAYGLYKGNEAFQGFQKAQQQEAAKQKAAEQEAAATHEESLQTLKKTDVSAYLAALKKDNDWRWESEFKVLDPRGYEAANKAEIAKLTLELKTVQANEVDRFLEIYGRLSALDPKNAEYQNKRDNYQRQLAEIYSRRHLEREQIENPKKFVTIENFAWGKSGFGSIMIANFSIKNSLPWAVKDVEIRCEHDAPSGTTIDSNKRTIYERIEAKKTKRLTEFNMGFIHSQATRSGCTVVGVVVIK